jgi:hypothetical protein
VFPLYDEKCLSRKAVHNWVQKFSQKLSNAVDDAQPSTAVARQQSKNFHAAGFDALVKRWDKRTSAGGGHVEN